uniref:Uncharacterized protein n=1 Tax=Panagrolaimus sp. PS1159 TaxID=55785 RepID=A0AC35EUC2_9BILA
MKYKAFVKAQSEHSHSADITKMEKDAAFSFLGLLGGGEKSTSKNSISGKTCFEEHTQYTTIETKGGSDVRKILNAKDADAVSSMDNIVGLEQEGIPIYTLIHRDHFPEKKYDTFTLFKVQQLIFNATKEYYEENTVYGCTDPTAENFDYQANYDEGESCKATKLDFFSMGFFKES